MNDARLASFDLAAAVAAPERLRWEPLREGVDIHRFYGGGDEAPSAALLRYRPGAEVPRHLHGGVEHILVLAGAQEDERGRYGPGTLVVNPAGTSHSVRSAEGCLVLAIWERPVRFLQPSE